MRFTGKRLSVFTAQADDDFEAALVTIERDGVTTLNMIASRDIGMSVQYFSKKLSRRSRNKYAG
jgi:hypothetical protein